jgi:hypothetical protein
MKSKQNKLNREQGRATRHFLQLCLLPLFMVLVCAGCKQEAKVAADTKTVAATAADINPVGTYALVSVDGNKVPCTVQHEGHALAVQSGSFTIKADGTCSTKTVFVPPSGTEATREVSATYTKEGSRLTMQWQGAGTTTGTMEGSTFTMDNEGMLFVYRK